MLIGRFYLFFWNIIFLSVYFFYKLFYFIFIIFKYFICMRKIKLFNIKKVSSGI